MYSNSIPLKTKYLSLRDLLPLIYFQPGSILQEAEGRVRQKDFYSILWK